MRANNLRVSNDHEIFQAKILERGRIAIFVGLIMGTVLGVVISIDTGSTALMVYFLLTQIVGFSIPVVRDKLPFWVVPLMPVMHFIFVVISAYLAQDPILAGFFLFEYVLFSSISLSFVMANVWSGVTVVGYLISASLNPNNFDYSLTFIIGYIMAAGIALAIGYVISSVIANISFEYSEGKLKVEEAGARYDVLLNSVGDGMIITDKKGFINFVNRRALDLMLASREQLLGQPVSAAVLMQDQSGTPLRHGDYPVTDVLARGERLISNMTSKRTYQIVRSDNSVFPVSLSVSPVQVMGTTDGAVVLFNDSSDFEEMEKAKSEFVSLASHQLRTPLNVVSWYVEKLLSQKKGSLNEKQLDYLQEIMASNARMISLVGDLLNVSRVDLGRRKRKHQEVDFSQLVRDLLREIDPLGKDKSLTINSTIPKGAIVFRDSDQSMMTVIIQNLLSNAVKYTPEKGSVSVQINRVFSGDEIDPERRVVAEYGGVLVTVADSGVGIPLAQQDKIFSRLFRADNVQSMDVEGTGLGLYVTQSFARILDGDIWFESKEGKGTTFYVYLPNKGQSV